MPTTEDDRLRTYLAELHVHTVLSPCAEVEMIPPFIVQEAIKKGICLIAITDHNASANVGAVQKAASGTGLTVLPGMELQTREEVHLLCRSPKSLLSANPCRNKGAPHGPAYVGGMADSSAQA